MKKIVANRMVQGAIASLIGIVLSLVVPMAVAGLAPTAQDQINGTGSNTYAGQSLLENTAVLFAVIGSMLVGLVLALGGAAVIVVDLFK